MTDDHIAVKIDGVIYVKLDDVKPMHARIEKLEAQLAQSQFIRWAARFEEQSDRIEKLEAALREIVDRAEHRTGHAVSDDVCVIARKALEGKDD